MTNPNDDVVLRGPELALDMLRKGYEKFLPVASSLIVSGKTLSQPEVLKAIETVRAILKDEREAKAAFDRLRVVRLEKSAVIRTAVRELQLAARVLIGETNPDLAVFGLVAKSERRKLTGAEIVVKTERARRTREARYTLGPQQKALLRGEPVASVEIRPAAPPGPTRIPA